MSGIPTSSSCGGNSKHFFFQKQRKQKGLMALHLQRSPSDRTTTLQFLGCSGASVGREVLEFIGPELRLEAPMQPLLLHPCPRKPDSLARVTQSKGPQICWTPYPSLNRKVWSKVHATANSVGKDAFQIWVEGCFWTLPLVTLARAPVTPCPSCARCLSCVARRRNNKSGAAPTTLLLLY